MAAFVDHYALLGVPYDATAKQLQKAYRKKALKLHPDRNPDPKAHDQFQELKKSFDLLSDEHKRKKFDLEIKSAFQKKMRYQKMDAERRSQREDLERRERNAKRPRTGAAPRTMSAAAARARDIKRMRAENARLIDTYNSVVNSRPVPVPAPAMPAQRRRRDDDQEATPSLDRSVRVAAPATSLSAALDEMALRELLSQFGDVVHVDMGDSKRRPSKGLNAIVCFASQSAAAAAVDASAAAALDANADAAAGTGATVKDLAVSWAFRDPRAAKESGRTRGNRSAGSEEEDGDKLDVTNALKIRWRQQQRQSRASLLQLLGKYGRVLHVAMGKSGKSALVCFATHSGAESTMAARRAHPELQVEWPRSQSRKRRTDTNGHGSREASASERAAADESSSAGGSWTPPVLNVPGVTQKRGAVASLESAEDEVFALMRRRAAKQKEVRRRKKG